MYFVDAHLIHRRSSAVAISAACRTKVEKARPRMNASAPPTNEGSSKRAKPSLPQLQRWLEQAEHRVADALSIPWPALARSWQRNVDEIKALIEELREGEGR